MTNVKRITAPLGNLWVEVNYNYRIGRACKGRHHWDGVLEDCGMEIDLVLAVKMVILNPRKCDLYVQSHTILFDRIDL